MRTTSTLSAGLALCFAAASLAACGGVDEKGEAEMKAAAESALATPATAGNPNPPLNDANIVAILDRANVNDSAGGNLASTKGTSADVKAFGKQMMTDHHTLRQQGIDLATKLGVSPTPPATDSLDMMARQHMDHLNSMAAGADWDRMYIDAEVQMHEAVLRTAQAAQGAAQNQELKDLIGKAAPAIQGHLDKAKALQAKLGGGTAGGAAAPAGAAPTKRP